MQRVQRVCFVSGRIFLFSLTLFFLFQTEGNGHGDTGQTEYGITGFCYLIFGREFCEQKNQIDLDNTQLFLLITVSSLLHF